MISNSPEFLKSLFLLDTSVTFLNHGSFGATPEPVFQNFQHWQRELEMQPVEFLGRRAASLMFAARSEVARYVGSSANNLVFVPNATTGINIVARSLKLQPGEEIVASDHEYGAMDRTWRFLSRNQGFKYINLPVSLPVSTANQFIRDIWKGVNDHTRVIFLSHITSPTALIFPIQEICLRARECGILTVIDGAHAPGQIPINLDELGADFYTGNLHKWLCAPKGSAFLFARPEVQHLIEPLVVSWGWESDFPTDSPFIDVLEWTGTRDLAPYLAAPAAIQFQEQYDWDQVRLRCHTLASSTQRQILDLFKLNSLDSNPDFWFAQMAAAPLPNGIDLSILKNRLYDDYKIEVPVLCWKNLNLIRFSFQGYNTQQDADLLLSALASLIPH